MRKEELEKWAEKIATRTADLVVEKLNLNGNAPGTSINDEYVNTKEAARILDVTPNYLLSMKDKFPHKKLGNHKQGRILFKKDGLLLCIDNEQPVK